MNYAGPIDAVEALRVANAQASIEFWQAAAFIVLLGLAIVAVVYAARRMLIVVRRALSQAEMVAFAIMAAVCTWAAQKRLVSFPITDPTMAYLTDKGSYVDTDTDVVHIDFSRSIVPDSAMMYVDCIKLGTNGLADVDSAWVNVFAATFGETQLPLEITYANATNHRWQVYTDWTPGPTVRTNGVWHANWARDRVKLHVIPVRTVIRVDGETIATPKSKEDSRK